MIGNLCCSHQELWDWPLLSTTASEFHSTWSTFTLLLSDALHFTTPSLPFAQVPSVPSLSLFNPNMSLINVKGFSLCVWQCTIIVLLTASHFCAPDELATTIMPQVNTPSFKTTKFFAFFFFFTFSCTHLVQNLNL